MMCVAPATLCGAMGAGRFPASMTGGVRRMFPSTSEAFLEAAARRAEPVNPAIVSP